MAAGKQDCRGMCMDASRAVIPPQKSHTRRWTQVGGKCFLSAPNSVRFFKPIQANLSGQSPHFSQDDSYRIRSTQGRWEKLKYTFQPLSANTDASKSFHAKGTFISNIFYPSYALQLLPEASPDSIFPVVEGRRDFSEIFDPLSTTNLSQR
jgi:hypothetical protein